jgi:hypothetical protein
LNDLLSNLPFAGRHPRCRLRLSPARELHPCQRRAKRVLDGREHGGMLEEGQGLR